MCIAISALSAISDSHNMYSNQRSKTHSKVYNNEHYNNQKQ